MSMSDEPTIRTLYLPLPADLWAQAAYLTMRPTVVREQASAMLVRVARMMMQLANDDDSGLEAFAALPAEKQAWILGLVRHVLTRFGSPSH
jgi:hypothetical protein